MFGYLGKDEQSMLKVGAGGENRPGLFLAVHGRSLYMFFSKFLFVYVRWYSLKVVGIPVKTMTLLITLLVSG